ncbi:MAG: hypothetical protein IT567_03360 [Alphaproteobacteria bacterium]|nr:hypothetical protein [Alphaproteobacteria bacterium]
MKTHGIDIGTSRPDGFTFSARSTMSPESPTFWGQIVGKMGVSVTVWDDGPSHSGREIQVYLTDSRAREKGADVAATDSSGPTNRSEVEPFAQKVADLLCRNNWKVYTKNSDIHWMASGNPLEATMIANQYKDISGNREEITEAIIRNVLGNGNIHSVYERYHEAGDRLEAIYSLQSLTGSNNSSLSSPRPGF